MNGMTMESREDMRCIKEPSLRDSKRPDYVTGFEDNIDLDYCDAFL